MREPPGGAEPAGGEEPDAPPIDTAPIDTAPIDAAPAETAPAETAATSERSHRRRARIARGPVVVVVAVVLVAGIVIGHNGAPRPAAASATATGPVVAPAAALSSSWFCAGATDTAKGMAPGAVVITNAADRAVTAGVTFLASNGRHRSEIVRIGAYSRSEIAETVPGGAPWIGAAVGLDGGVASVEQQITSSLGTTADPCATAGSRSWYFAAGATLINASSTLNLLNPYPTTAVVDLRFTTNEGVEQPTAFEAMAIAPDSLLAVNLGSNLRRRTQIATTVHVSSGRLVAWKTDLVIRPVAGTPILGTKAATAPEADPASPYLGVNATLGTPAASTLWEWPEGVTQSGVDEQYVLYNPGSTTAQVQLAVHLDEGSAEPLTLTVGPEEVTAVVTSQQARIPPGVGYSATLRSTNGVPIVAERTVDEGPPAARHGTAELFGASRAAAGWLVGAGEVRRGTDEEIVISNPGASSVSVTLDSVAAGQRQPLPGVGAVRLAPFGRAVFDLGAIDKTFDAAVLVTASGPIVVGRDLYGRGGANGLSLSLGAPLSS